MAIRYLNTDLDVESPEALDVLVDALGKSLLVLHNGPKDDGGFRATFELQSDVDTPELTILGFCTAVESLEPELREVWDNCPHKVVDVGFEGAEHADPYRHEMEAHTLRRVAELGIAMAVTIYSPDPTLPDQSAPTD